MIWVDPQKAREWLRTADTEPPINLGEVMEYLHRMETGDDFDRRLEWRDGRLYNGRHRLLAIILHGTSVRMEAVQA